MLETARARFLTPSPVLTGEGRDEGEFKRMGRTIHQRFHRAMLFISGKWQSIGAPAAALVIEAYRLERPSRGTFVPPSPTKTRARVVYSFSRSDGRRPG
ncbi:hypothetical protein [Planctopirus hydrillae]|uniref:hypothetical protein n=1 Tax=Planctopirus hydrillae TaxID=1841610 RepID=UPI001042192D|nr:hypothetical protein [Planctopirus hydrillae]